MSSLKRKIASAGAHYFWNPVMRLFAGRRGAPALLETVGRKSGRLRRNPVGNGLDGNTFWIVAEHGRHSDWVRNIVANPRVRVKVNGVWRSGVACLMPDDDPIARQRRLDRFNARIVRFFGTELATVRIDLDVERSHP
jgi:deazaflavin-dependent oxidoreductase (nitroreductase family)